MTTTRRVWEALAVLVPVLATGSLVTFLFLYCRSLETEISGRNERLLRLSETIQREVSTAHLWFEEELRRRCDRVCRIIHAMMDQRSPADVVMSDRVMAGMDGLEPCRKVRRFSKPACTYFIPLTVMAGKANLDEAMKGGGRRSSTSGRKILTLCGDAGTEVPVSALPCVNCHGFEGEGRPEGGVSPSNVT